MVKIIQRGKTFFSVIKDPQLGEKLRFLKKAVKNFRSQVKNIASGYEGAVNLRSAPGSRHPSYATDVYY